MYEYILIIVLFIIIIVYITSTSPFTPTISYKSNTGTEGIIGGGRAHTKRSPRGRSPHVVQQRQNNKIIATGGTDWVLIYSNGCGHCTMQKSILDENRIKVTRILNTNPSVNQIKEEGDIIGFPLWYNVKTKKRRYGCIDIDELRKML